MGVTWKDFEWYAQLFNNNKKLKILLYLTIFSFFYNLGIVEFKISGENPIRIYDITGFFLLMYFFKHSRYFISFIKSLSFSKWLFYFILWSFITMFITLSYYLFISLNIIRVIQTLIYMFHMIIYFVFFLFFIHLLSNKKEYQKVLYFIIILVILESLLIILQHLNIIPFLWGERRKWVYRGFLSGTLGPNRIVLGMSMLMVIAILMPNLVKRIVKINRFLLIAAIVLSFVMIILSGSRTSYIGLLVFLMYFFLGSPGKFIKSILILVPFFLGFYLYQHQIIDRAILMFKHRVTNKISYETKEKEDPILLYEDLGSGRLDLAKKFIKNLSENLYAIPFGTGFNNRMLFKTSPHNMYLTLIRDVGLVGFFLYLMWLFSYLNLKNPRKELKVYYISLHGIVWAMLVTLFFGEHLYIFRPLYALWGMFLFITAILMSPLFFWDKKS